MPADSPATDPFPTKAQEITMPERRTIGRMIEAAAVTAAVTRHEWRFVPWPVSVSRRAPRCRPPPIRKGPRGACSRGCRPGHPRAGDRLDGRAEPTSCAVTCRGSRPRRSPRRAVRAPTGGPRSDRARSGRPSRKRRMPGAYASRRSATPATSLAMPSDERAPGPPRARTAAARKLRAVPLLRPRPDIRPAIGGTARPSPARAR